MLLSQYLVSFRQNDNGMPRFIAYLMTIKHSASAAASEFCEWVQIGIEAASSAVAQSWSWDRQVAVQKMAGLLKLLF